MGCVMNRLSVANNNHLRRLVAVAGPLGDVVGNFTVELHSNGVNVAINLLQQVTNMRADAAAIAVFEQRDRSPVGLFKQSVKFIH